MALRKREIEQIVARDMPGYRVARQHVADTVIAKAAESPGIGALRDKYLGRAPVSDNPGHSVTVDLTPEDTGDQIVAVEPKEPSHPFDAKARPKAVVISGKSKRVIGQQG